MDSLLLALRNLGPVRIGAMVAVVIAMFAFFSFVTTRVGGAPNALLYSQLDPSDAGAIVQKLEALQIPYEVNTAGTEIKVPQAEVGKIRMQMAADGLPRGGSIGYELFDQPEGFGTTSFVQNINHLRALEGELARTISTLAPVQSARVHLVLPQRELFNRREQQATASVFLKLRSARGLGAEQVAAIQQLVSAAVPALDPNRISIVDERGNLLARATNPNTEITQLSNQDDIRATFEAQLVGKIEELLSPTVGYGAIRAQVSADLDFDRITTSSEIFDPDSAVVRSTQSVTEEALSNNSSGSAETGIGTSLPAVPGEAAATGPTASNVNNENRAEETTNFEINRTTQTHVRQGGQVRRLSVAVVVDGIYTKAEDGTQTYAPRGEEELQQIRALVQSAVNFDPARGDTIEVRNMRFQQPEQIEAPVADEIFGIPQADVFRMAETLVLALVGLLVVLLVVRPLLNRLLASASVAAPGAEGARALAAGGGAGIAQLSAPGGGALAQQLSGEAAAAEAAMEQMIDISRVEGRVRASALRKVGEIVEKHPEEAVSILRNWMYQDSNR